MPNYLKGTKAIGPDSNPQRKESTASKILEFLTGYPSDPNKELGPMDLLAAAIPFSAPLGKVFHGTNKSIKFFNNKKADVMDRFGHYIHFSERPEYAEMYPKGFTSLSKL